MKRVAKLFSNESGSLGTNEIGFTQRIFGRGRRWLRGPIGGVVSATQTLEMRAGLGQAGLRDDLAREAYERLKAEPENYVIPFIRVHPIYAVLVLLKKRFRTNVFMSVRRLFSYPMAKFAKC